MNLKENKNINKTESVLSLIQANKDIIGIEKAKISLESLNKIMDLNSTLETLNNINNKKEVTLEDGLFLLKNILSPINHNSPTKVLIKRILEVFKFEIFGDKVDIIDVSDDNFVGFETQKGYQILIDIEERSSAPSFIFDYIYKVDDRHSNYFECQSIESSIIDPMNFNLIQCEKYIDEYLRNKEEFNKSIFFKKHYKNEMDDLKNAINLHYNSGIKILNRAYEEYLNRSKLLIYLSENTKNLLTILDKIGFKIVFRNFSYFDIKERLMFSDLSSVNYGLMRERNFIAVYRKRFEDLFEGITVYNILEKEDMIKIILKEVE